MFKDRHNKHQTFCVLETYRISGGQCRKFQGDKKNFSQVQWEQLFYRNSSGLAITELLLKSWEFPWETHRCLGSSLAAFGTAALPRLLLGTAHGHNPWTSSRLWPGAAVAWVGTGRVTGSCKEAEAREGDPQGQGHWVPCFNYEQDNSYVSNSNISVCSTSQCNGNSYLNRSVQSLLV